tara:strand:- start:5228 stop:5707 length:480 start_codon:yes stop_codon:yes gene_type:complete
MAIHKVDGVDGDANFPKKFVTLHGTAAITKGQCVQIDTDDTTNGLGGSVKIATVGANANESGPMCFGVAAETITEAGTIKIQTAGKFEDAFVVDAADTVVGHALVGPLNGATAGSLSAQTAATFGGPVVAYAIEVEGTGTGESGTALRCDIMIIDQGLF